VSNQAKLVELEIRERLAIVTINNPPVNPLTKEVLAELERTVDELSVNEEVWAVIITGGGEKAFVAGADIRQFPQLKQEDGRKMAEWGQRIFDKIAGLKKPVIAAINGFALGGGCELAMACDIRLASKKAKFGQPEVTLGITPGFAGTQRLPRLVGRAIAKELIFTGDMIDAEEAYRIGLVNKVYEPEELMDKAREMAKRILSRGMIAVQLCKAAINNGMNMDTESAYNYEAEVFGLCFATQDQKEGMTAFVEKRKANFKGR